jgi:hypothetical protein
VSRRVIFGSFLALVVAAAMPAWAGGVYLKLSTEVAEAQAGRPFRVTLSAVVTRPAVIPARPEVLVDSGQGPKVRTDVQWRPVEGTGELEVTPDAARRATYELALPEPGTYKVKLRYRLGNDVVETNKVTLKVGPSEAPAAAAR